MQYVENVMKKQEITNWFLNGADPDTGRRLLEKYASNPRQARMAKGMTIGMVTYELKLLLGIPQSEIFAKKKSDVELVTEFCHVAEPESPSTEKEHSPSPQLNPTTSKPDSPEGLMLKAKTVAVDTVILQAKEMISALTVKVSRTHREMFDMGEANTAKNKSLRKTMVEEIRTMSDLKERIYDLKERYFETGKVDPELRTLIKEAEDLLNPVPVTKSGKKEDFTKVDGAELFRRKENLRKTIAKYSNKLKYQTNTRQATENPMPEGPERVKTERKLEELRRELTAVQNELQKRNQTH